MSIRTEKLASVIKKDLGEILQRNYQPSGTFITITQVRVTDDLSIAKVYLSILSPGRDEEPLYKMVDDLQDDIRYKLASKIRHQVRRIPELLFFHDDTAEYVNKIETLFSETKEDDSPKKEEDK
ncbi:MAG: 30S ribosome-binding factor RbfA [Balneolaceae bacterium]